MIGDLNIITLAVSVGILVCGVTLLILWLAARPRGSR